MFTIRKFGTRYVLQLESVTCCDDFIAMSTFLNPKISKKVASIVTAFVPYTRVYTVLVERVVSTEENG